MQADEVVPEPTIEAPKTEPMSLREALTAIEDRILEAGVNCAEKTRHQVVTAQAIDVLRAGVDFCEKYRDYIANLNEDKSPAGGDRRWRSMLDAQMALLDAEAGP